MVRRMVKGMFSVLRTRVVEGSKSYFIFLNLLLTLERKMPFLRERIHSFMIRRKRIPFIIRNDVGSFLVYPNDDTIRMSSELFDSHLHGWLDQEEPDTLVDVGGAIGLYSILAVNKKGYKRSLVFEPNPMAYKVLKTNVRLNSSENMIEAHNQGISDSDKSMHFFLDKFNTEGSRIIEDEEIKDYEMSDLITIRTEKLDKILTKEHKRISTIKIDVGGHELSVIKGMKTVLKRLGKGARIFLSISEDNEDEIKGILESRGFSEIERIDSDRLYEKR